jgi:membrane-associated phospholipid phosphatase
MNRQINPPKRTCLAGCLSLLALGICSTLVAQPRGNGLPDYLGPRFAPAAHATAPPQPSPGVVNDAAEVLRHWNQIALNATGLDHTPVAPGENRVFGEQLGPTRSSRAMAIIHIAMFDAVTVIAGGCERYTHIHPASRHASINAAIMQAAHDTLVALYPSQQATFDGELAGELNQINAGRARSEGVDVGRRAAAAILTLRANDGSEQPEPRLGVQFFTSDAPGKWRQDPISQSPIALGAYWGNVTPFVMHSATQFRAPTPPGLTTPEYTAAYDEVKLVGGDGAVTPTTRTAEQTDIGIFWAYDGTPSLCAPPRLYNQIAMHIADQMGTTANAVDLARLLALVNVSLADTAITLWESKYFYQYWRPVTGIRESDPGSGPTGSGDGNPDTIGDPTFTPLGAPASNLTGPNFTPPFPSYPSGHAGFGGALFQTLRNFYQTDDIAFTFTSDEFNGITRDNSGNVRPLIPRSFSSLSQAEEENGQSRIYLGIHWVFDKTEGIAQGRNVANFVFANAFTQERNKHSRGR